MINIIKTLYLKYFELTSAICATLIIVLAILMEKLLYLNACNLCILARFAFAGIALVSLSAHFFKKYQLTHKLCNIFFSLSGLVFMGRQIMLQNLPEEEVMMLEGCGLPLFTTFEYYGVFNGILMALKGGSSCAKIDWEFIFNFAEWGFLFFSIYLITNLHKIFSK